MLSHWETAGWRPKQPSRCCLPPTRTAGKKAFYWKCWRRRLTIGVVLITSVSIVQNVRRAFVFTLSALTLLTLSVRKSLALLVDVLLTLVKVFITRWNMAVSSLMHLLVKRRTMENTFSTIVVSV